MTSDQLKVKFLEEELAKFAENFSALQESVEHLERQAEAQQAPLQEIVDSFNSLKGGIKVLGWLGAIAKWVSVVTAGGTAAWIYWSKLSGK